MGRRATGVAVVDSEQERLNQGNGHIPTHKSKHKAHKEIMAHFVGLTGEGEDHYGRRASEKKSLGFQTREGREWLGISVAIM